MEPRLAYQASRACIARYLGGLAILLAPAGLLALLPSAPASLAQTEVVPQLLGNPFKARYPDSGGSAFIYSRNPWDMQTFGGRIYFAYGSSVDNTGPVDIPYFDPSSGFQFDTGTGGVPFIADEEQLLRFRILSGVLVSPGRDPLGSPASGNFYRREPPGWVKYATVSQAAHVQDIYWFQNRLFVGAQTSAGATSIQVSDTNGATWQNITLAGASLAGSSPTIRVSGLFELGGTLYSSTIFAPFGHAVWRYDGIVNGTNQFTDLGFTIGNNLFPSTTMPPGLMRIERWVLYAGHTVYLGVTPDSRGHEWTPVGLYKATALDTAQRLALPSGAVAWDLLVGSDGKLYVLANIPINSTQHLVIVYVTVDLTSWTEVLRFTRTDGTFARSFEMLNGDFYFGLGGAGSAPPPTTGDILRVARAALSTPSPTFTGTPTATATGSASATATVTRSPPPTATATRTATPTATGTPTPPPTSFATASATPTLRANVEVAVAPGAPGHLRVTLTARGAGCVPNNRLQAVQVTVLGNGHLEWPGPPPALITAPSYLPVPGAPATYTFTVVRVTVGLATTVHLLVTDSCGTWPTFVGGGPAAF